MMKISFDLISDLHVETWPEPFNWEGMPTSTIAVVAGDISRDRTILVETLQHLGQCYNAVLYIDGNDEHRWSLNELGDSYRSLVQQINGIENVVYIQDNVVVIDGVGFVGTNGWWTFDFDEPMSYEESKQWFIDRYKIDVGCASAVEMMALQDARYLTKSIKKLQTHQDIKQLVVVTHTVPTPELVEHDVDLEGTHMINCIGSSHLIKALSEDLEGKVHTWCFGHYHGDVDQAMYGVRFVNNYRGRGDTPWCKSVYHPKKINVYI